MSSDEETETLSPQGVSSLNSDMHYDADKVKIAVIGDEGVGKTCLLMSFRPNNSSLVPSVFEGIMVEKEISIHSTTTMMQLNLCDTQSTGDYLALRIKSYRNCDIIFVCFDIGDVHSLQSVTDHWLPEVAQYARNALLLLVGLKSDVRSKTDDELEKVPLESIQEVQRQHPFVEYIECSALKKSNIDTAFSKAIEHFVDSGGRHRKSTKREIVDDDDEDLATTHTRQWTEHLNEMGMTDDAFSAFKPVPQMGHSNAAQSHGFVGSMPTMVGGHPMANGMGGMAGAMSMPMGMNGMAMGFSPHSFGSNAQYGLAASMQQHQHSMASSYGMGSMGSYNTGSAGNLISMDGSQRQLQHVEEDLDIDGDVNSPSNSDLEELKRMRTISIDAQESIDYAGTGKKPPKNIKGGCCLVM